MLYSPLNGTAPRSQEAALCPRTTPCVSSLGLTVAARLWHRNLASSTQVVWGSAARSSSKALLGYTRTGPNLVMHIAAGERLKLSAS